MSLGALLGLVGFVVLLLWVVRRHESAPTRRRERHRDIDYEVLEAAEREVRDADAGVNPEEGFTGDDWGPGAPRT